MGEPPSLRDPAGRMIPCDDPDTSNEAYLVRYVHRLWLAPDNAGGRRLSKAAFSPSSEARDPYRGMSTELLHLILNDGLSPLDRKPADHEGSVKLKVGDLRRLGLSIAHDPVEGNPYHASVWGVTRATQKQMLRMYEWIDKPLDVN